MHCYSDPPGDGDRDSSGEWSFPRRLMSPVTPGAGVRRRSSIEVTMPWRAQLEQVIAAAAADSDSSGPGTDGSASDKSSFDRSAPDLDVDVDVDVDDYASAHEYTDEASGSMPRVSSSQQDSSDADSSSSGTFPVLGLGGAAGVGGSGFAGFDRQSSNSSRRGSRGYHNMTQGGAALELFVRLNRARQTLDFAKRQATAFAELDKAEMGIWEALNVLNELREYEAALSAPGADELDAELSLRDHAFQVCGTHPTVGLPP